MKAQTAIVPLFILAASILTGCGPDRDCDRTRELAVTRYLERAIEVGERALEEQRIIEHIALTEGTDAALDLKEELHHQEHYLEFWDLLKSADSVWREIPDSLEREAVLGHMKAYIAPILTITDGIRP